MVSAVIAPLAVRRYERDTTSMQFSWSSLQLRKIGLGAALTLVLMFTVPHYVATSSAAYKLAVASAHSSPIFLRTLGSPVKEAWFLEGEIVWGESADMEIPVRGKQRNGTLRVAARSNSNHWKLTKLVLEVDGPSEKIDLLSK